MSIKQDIKRLLRSFGYDVCRFTPTFHTLARRKKIFEFYAINTVLDVGANAGQFAQELRKDIGFKKRILSFEPLSSAFKMLKTNAKGDSNWEIFNFALGDDDTKQEINIAGNFYSSSLLDMLPSHEKFAPDSKYIGKEVIEIKKLDSVFSDLCRQSDKIYLKIDTQGFESRILMGAEKSLAHIDLVQLEMSLVPLYKDELLFNELHTVMNKKGFTLIAIENGFSEPVSGHLLQIDGIFHRVSS
jgi:FkbM family methyltransferase